MQKEGNPLKISRWYIDGEAKAKFKLKKNNVFKYFVFFFFSWHQYSYVTLAAIQSSRRNRLSKPWQKEVCIPDTRWICSRMSFGIWHRPAITESRRRCQSKHICQECQRRWAALCQGSVSRAPRLHPRWRDEWEWSEESARWFREGHRGGRRKIR